MSNNIALAEKFQPILDEIYKVASLTGRMDSPTKPISFAGANVVNVYKTSVVGLGNYSRADGYPKGEVIGRWEALELTRDRARELSVDAMDDEETLGMAFGTLVGEFMRTQVVPEVDAYRFSTYAGWSGIGAATPTTLTSNTVLAAIDAAHDDMNTYEVPKEGRLLFVSDPVNSMIKAALTRQWGNERGPDRRVENLDGTPVIPVPQARFNTEITLNDGKEVDEGGFSATGEDINFLLIHPTAVLQATKHAPLKIFDPSVNQSKDAYMFQYRLYHDAFVYDNKVKGVYLHAKAEAGS